MDLARLEYAISQIKNEIAGSDKSETSSLIKIIGGIKAVYIKDWEEYYENFITQFLCEIEMGMPTVT